MGSKGAASATNNSSSSANNTGGVSNNAEPMFNVGSVVSLKTRTDVFIKGEVVAYDSATRFIILKTPLSKNHSGNDVHMVNLNMVSEIQVCSESKETPPPLPNLNLPKLDSRLKDQVEKKKRLIMGFKAGVSVEGQNLFRAISKTLDDVVWEGKNISVMSMVTIIPPYKPENVKGTRNIKAYNHVKKIVEKHISDEAVATSRREGTSSSSGSNSKKDVPSSWNNGTQRESSSPYDSPPLSGGASIRNNNREPKQMYNQ